MLPYNLFVLSLLVSAAHGFTVGHSRTPKTVASALLATRSRSRVSDPTGPTPSEENEEIETIKLEDIPELKYDRDNHPIPHQPWRRGITDGCEDPIDAAWRQEGEEIIRKAIEMVGGTLVDVTWFLTHLMITLDDDFEKVPRDYLKSTGVVIDIREPEPPLYKDPADPNPEDIYSDRGETEAVYERDTLHEDDIKSKMYSRREDDEEEMKIDENEVSLYTAKEAHEDDALRVADDAELFELREERSIQQETLQVDTAALSIIGGAIMDALETEEDRLRILDRHEIVLTSPGAPDVLETQKEFDAHRGHNVAVETEDPWESNRTLRGKLVDRNSMDVILNVQGRMVTVPLNFVKCVRLPAARRNQESDQEEVEESEE